MQRLPIGKIGSAPPTNGSTAPLSMELTGATLSSFDDVVFVPPPENRRTATSEDGKSYPKSPYCLDFKLAKTGPITKEFVMVTLTSADPELKFQEIGSDGLGAVTAGTKEAASLMWYVSCEPTKVEFLIKNDQLDPALFEFNLGVIITNGKYAMPVLLDPKVYNTGGGRPPPTGGP